MERIFSLLHLGHGSRVVDGISDSGRFIPEIRRNWTFLDTASGSPAPEPSTVAKMAGQRPLRPGSAGVVMHEKQSNLGLSNRYWLAAAVLALVSALSQVTAGAPGGLLDPGFELLDARLTLGSGDLAQPAILAPVLGGLILFSENH
jgi:hypothetical protein